YNNYAAAHPDDTYTGTNGNIDDSPTGQALKAIYPQGTGSNGCLLIQSTVGSAGALFTNEVLSPDEISAVSGGSSSVGNRDRGKPKRGARRLYLGKIPRSPNGR